MICSERRSQNHSTINIVQHAVDVIVSHNDKVLLITANHVFTLLEDSNMLRLTLLDTWKLICSIDLILIMHRVPEAVAYATLIFTSNDNHNNHNNTHISVQPPNSQAQPQRLPLPARKRSTLILMVGIFLNRSLLTHLAYSTHQLASSCVISVGKFLSIRGKSEKHAFCFKDARCSTHSCNVSLPYYFTTVYLPLTAPADWSYPFGIICNL